jgi:hypothetical protein
MALILNARRDEENSLEQQDPKEVGTLNAA